jgi:hypothetical protein
VDFHGIVKWLNAVAMQLTGIGLGLQGFLNQRLSNQGLLLPHPYQTFEA